MRAVQFSRFGPPDVLDVIEIPVPELAPGEVLVRVHAAGVNYFEVLMRADRYAVTPELPMIPGVEVAGVVERVGEGADPDLLGVRVGVPLFALGRGGGYAEFIAVDATSLVHLPDHIGFDDAVALMVQGLTALHMTRRNPPTGKSVLVTAAGGGVGSLLVQLAKREGARQVIAAASTKEKRDIALSLGADLAIDYGEANWADVVRALTDDVGVDILYDTVGGSVTKAALAALAPAGELVFAALGRFDLDKADVDQLFSQNQSLKGFALLPLLSPDNIRSDLTELFELAANQRIRVPQGGQFSLREAWRAHEAIERRAVSGKIVLVP
ncbi:zinc-binding alcohol dehydrogenase family protein [Agrobacterium sp. SHOUNA12C]|uniref:quinone oxidoreductase family protein n=1 Tax=Rhizobium rhizogenes TaxID=359 RepID=UPI0012390BED|nr:zinc-binding alcohol dehydrogenase family protein [Rhizobium rhizogenes]KAA6488574.1 zinc-binding alcohol dehydrogenase family protein [Agrobacterium sp. ICMP 7243]MCJ9721867.1 zinc-binding alcohol dehydrogenase family protein [Agrobacterium sp. BETTINA12B]MCJ9756427.1 zinc-binding alcohol dehydrogenase family protein [Agrobacterium sp. SHOUNA12C]NTF52188.1 zinc-binding alcohol dehydrogenase family protein [Rhizobium rhizogenes]NTG17732.1 zinc-binding alcohol dehydrogenase family protein [R